VQGIADQLVADGIDVILDQYSPVPDEGWPLWMEQNLDVSDFVLLVCTEIYLGVTQLDRKRVCNGDE
jgi:hypothetical protein